MTGRFFTLKADGIGSEGGLAVSSVKSAEDGGLVLRVVGLTNKALDASLNFDTTVPAITRAYLTDLTERHEIGSAKIIWEGKAVTFTVPAYGIATLRVQF